MVNKTISLSLWTNDKLKQEFNASGLIERLLREHYQYTDKDKLLEAQIEVQKAEEKRLKKEKIEMLRKKCMEEEGELWKNMK